MSRQEPLEAAAVWLAQACADFDAAAVITELAPHVACFQAQQAAEKATQALYVAQGVDFRFTHSVFDLVATAQDVFPTLERFKDQAATLDDYYVGTRYPLAGLLATTPPSSRYSPQLAAGAVEMARGILEECQRLYGELVPKDAQSGQPDPQKPGAS
ncbi:MAG: HEPN domain-containing protein [Thermaerobacter sp.]|nr:HEPN domain-containing protein [Thermaerobacter sp.]